MKKYGYARVSSKEQHLDRQIAVLKEQGIDDSCLFSDKASGKNFNRKKYKKMIKKMTAGDVLYVASLDRFGRNYDEILEQWRYITRSLEADIVVLDFPILDTRREIYGIAGVLITDIVLEVLSYAAQIEREKILQRQKEGVAQAHLRGVVFGRPSKKPKNWESLYPEIILKNISVSELSVKLGVNRSTIYRWMKSSQV